VRILLLLLLAAPAQAIPVVPSFSSGTLTSTTQTKTKVVEVINSYDYRSGWEWSVTGTNIAPVGGVVSPAGLTTTTNSINGVASRWTGLDPATKPVWNIVTPGAAFQMTETLNGPGLTNHTLINRETDVESLTETTSVFTQ